MTTSAPRILADTDAPAPRFYLRSAVQAARIATISACVLAGWTTKAMDNMARVDKEFSGWTRASKAYSDLSAILSADAERSLEQGQHAVAAEQASRALEAAHNVGVAAEVLADIYNDSNDSNESLAATARQLLAEASSLDATYSFGCQDLLRYHDARRALVSAAQFAAANADSAAAAAVDNKHTPWAVCTAVQELSELAADAAATVEEAVDSGRWLLASKSACAVAARCEELAEHLDDLPGMKDIADALVIVAMDARAAGVAAQGYND